LSHHTDFRETAVMILAPLIGTVARLQIAGVLLVFAER
jgi:hypothetical protein